MFTFSGGMIYLFKKKDVFFSLCPFWVGHSGCAGVTEGDVASGTPQVALAAAPAGGRWCARRFGWDGFAQRPAR